MVSLICDPVVTLYCEYMVNIPAFSSIYLNKITTHELNTPSRQQCMLSHMERNASRRLLRRLKPAIQNPQEFTDIPEVDYLDPLEVLQEQKTFNKIKLYSICKGDV